jgi:hypothetical protein
MKPAPFTVLLLPMLAIGVVAFMCPADAAPAAEVFSLVTTHNVEVCMPATCDQQQVLYRDTDHGWRTMPVETTTDGMMRLQIDVSKISQGRTLLVLGAPAGTNMADREPPAVVQITIDGQDYGSVDRVALGGVEAAPRTLAIEIQDELSMLRTRSLLVSINGRRHALRDPGVELQRLSSRRAIVVLELSKLISQLATDNMIRVSMDDYALDEAALNCYISFRRPPSCKLADGTLMSVDTVTPKPGWQDWTVVADGEKLDSTYSTTAGHTWRSLASEEPHWIKMEFPEPREVSGVALSWAYWQTFHSSAAYKVQTWDGERWVTQAEVRDQETQHCSEHVFAPVTTKAIRVWQPPMSGHVREQGTMWISEFEVL